MGDALVWGLVATVVQTVLMSGAQWLGLSRMSLPFILGTIFTANRDLAALLGFVAHVLNGWLFALVYAAIFESLGYAGPGVGALLGLGQALFVMLALVPLLPGVHPRMASEKQGPEPTRGLEPPGFLALNYGRWTPSVAVFAHLVYGITLGTFYSVVG